MSAHIRLALPEDAPLLPAIERSAAQAFRLIDGSDLHIHELSVMQSAQGQGWGRRLVETAMEHARLNQLACVTLTTFTEVPWNAPFYRRLGFEHCAGATLDKRLAQILVQEYDCGFAPDSRCAMSWRVPWIP